MFPSHRVRVLHVYKDYFPVVGGIENHLRVLAEAQAAAGHDVVVLACAPGPRTGREVRAGVQVHKAARLGTFASMPLSLDAPWRILRAAADVVHVHAPFPLGEAAAAWSRDRPLVITHHSDVIRQQRLLRLWGPLLGRVLDRADAIIATSEPYAASSPWLAPRRARVHVVPLGIDARPFTALDRSPWTGPLRLLFVGALRHYKGVDVLLRALGELPEATLQVVGAGPMRAPWEALAGALGLGGRVRFAGRVDDAALPALYRDADVLVLPSTNRAEAFGTVLLEGMAAGLPVVSTELGTGTSWVNRDGQTGRVVPPDDPRALAAALAELERDPPLRARLGAAGRARVQTEWTVPRMVAAVDLVYKEALAHWRRAVHGQA